MVISGEVFSGVLAVVDDFDLPGGNAESGGGDLSPFVFVASDEAPTDSMPLVVFAVNPAGLDEFGGVSARVAVAKAAIVMNAAAASMTVRG